MVFGLLHFNTETCGGDWCDYEHFFEVSSEFYPDLGRYYEERLAAWFKKKWDEVRAEDE